MISKCISRNSILHTTNYIYDNDNRPTAIQYGADARKVEYTYDELGRIDAKTTRNGTLTRGTSYHITSETREGVTTTYSYDGLGQLTRVNDPHDTASGNTGTTWVYNYDRGGNITSKVRYAYTTGTLGTALETIPYSYTDSNWKDKLTAYNGQAITYDAIGNLLSDGTWTYSWQAGRQLAQMSKSGTTVQCQYDANGLRVGKTVNGTETTYTLHGKLLTHLKQGANEMHFYYDAQSRPAMVNFNGAYYMYLHNLQGDVVGLVDSSNNLVVEYKYDAWGRPTLKRTLTTAYDTLATLNPFRYRGYVYDEETGLYYVSSRYYDPEIGRWINADNTEMIDGGNDHLLENNLFAYCFNNLINMTDDTGCWPEWATNLIKVGIGALAIGVGVVATAVTGGAAAPVLVASVKIALTSAAVGAVVGAGTGAVSHRISTGSWSGAEKAALNGAVDGAANGFMLGGISAGVTFTTVAVKGVQIQQIGRLKPSNKSGEGYQGVQYKNQRGSLRSFELHSPHKGGPHQQWHWQRNTWNPKTGKITGRSIHWTLFGRRF